ncbi:MAG: hypothetical protein AB2A00_31410 [Myxococcota bacterium]
MSASRPFSTVWCVASVVLYTVVELALGGYLGPVVAGRYLSPMLHMRMMTVLHLASFFLGGILVGVLSPGVRLVEPAVGAVIAVALTMLMSVFLPAAFLHFSLDKLLWGGGIAFVLALLGAWTGEKWMGNVEEEGPTRRARLRHELWSGEEGIFVPRSRADHARRKR